MTIEAGERPLCNRVTPTGELMATPHRGTMYGNRGVLHNDRGILVRRAQVRRWLVCELSFRGRRRTMMQPGRYTELFFLDEAVALAAGHRPCAECRHADYQRFRSLWTTVCGLAAPPRAEDIDDVLHAERALADGARRTCTMPAGTLPDGAFVEWQGEHWVLDDGAMVRWSPSGYVHRRAKVATELSVLTPPSTVAVIRAGFRPRLHPSVQCSAPHTT